MTLFTLNKCILQQLHAFTMHSVHTHAMHVVHASPHVHTWMHTYLIYIKLELTRDRLRSLHLVRYILFVRSISFVTGGNVLLPHFLRRVLYRWLHSSCKSVTCNLSDITFFSQTVNASLFARWQQATTAHLQ